METEVETERGGTAFDVLTLAIGVALVATLLFLPLVLVSGYAGGGGAVGRHSAEAMVGTGVLLRVALRRVFRTAARSLLQTTLGTFSRASARTVTRRVVRLAVKSAAVTVKGRYGEDDLEGTPRQSLKLALGLSLLTLAGSFYGVLWVIGPEASQAMTGSHSPLSLAALSAVPMLMFTLLVRLFSRWHGVEARFSTSWDGMILQAYFTGAGSFLPLATDVEYHGERRAQAWTASSVLGSLLALHWILHFVGRSSGWWTVEFLGVMTIIYAFVYSFPLRPLDGYYLWSDSKWKWAVLWTAMLVSFIRNVPDSVQGIL